ncbi:hypothetical protein [Sphingomonas sp.]|uniref:hypothetical protein n=1 Tax=Sphingomonas sp. TaxID=28214 RepID=UPI003B00AEED
MIVADPARLLLRTLRRSAAAANCVVALSHEAETRWSSATFVGGQHRVAVMGDAIDGWLVALPEADLPMNGCFVASCAVERTATGALLTVLVLEE